MVEIFGELFIPVYLLVIIVLLFKVWRGGQLWQNLTGSMVIHKIIFSWVIVALFQNIVGWTLLFVFLVKTRSLVRSFQVLVDLYAVTARNVVA